MFICEVGPLQNQRILFRHGLDNTQAPLLSLSWGMSSWGVEVLSEETSEGSISTTSECNHLEYDGFPCPQLLLASISANSTNSHVIIIWVPMSSLWSPIFHWIFIPKEFWEFPRNAYYCSTICHLRKPAITEDSTAFSHHFSPNHNWISQVTTAVPWLYHLNQEWNLLYKMDKTRL